jgi:hypothetical protein
MAEVYSPNATLCKAISDLTKVLGDGVDRVERKRKEMTVDEILDHHLLGDLFTFRSYANCYKSSGVGSRDELDKVIECHPHDKQLQEVYRQLVQMEGKFHALIQELNDEVISAHSADSSLANDVVDNVELYNMTSGQNIKLYDIFKTSPHTLLVLLRHYG